MHHFSHPVILLNYIMEYKDVAINKSVLKSEKRKESFVYVY